MTTAELIRQCREALGNVEITHREDDKEVCFDWCPSCRREAALRAIDEWEAGGGDSAAAWQALAEEYRTAMEKHPCRCSKALKNACPTCGETLIAVRYSGYLNSDQWDSIKGGDWYCNTCTDPSVVNGKKHWHDRELESITYQQCDRCFAIASTTPADALARRDERIKALGAADYLEAAAVKRWTLPYNVMHAEAAALRKKAGE